MPHIGILVHEHDAFEQRRYFLKEIADVWREKGLGVSVLPTQVPRPDVDIAILHVDMTVVPADQLALVSRYPQVLNGRVADISKARISRSLVRRSDDYQGPVIVKTNRNFGGTMEAQKARSGPIVSRLRHSLRSRLPWTMQSRLSISDYRIFDSKELVPRAVWYNPDLVVERFLPERRDGDYCLRVWMFLGDKETNTLCYSEHPIVKAENIVRRESVPEVPNDLRKLREELGFDFGKFDYVIADDRVVLFDANRTPSLGQLPKERTAHSIRVLAEGIHAFL